ncbi:hypothetical protein PsorP6_005956 [Peronosclerospora sorghi]|uniref:Uncharacterized protein n=1 Tax=Peronosclerospora sorghi TaxID=230839 RepID=A0ACC0W2M3_9STRA|nr:hypothetical protein PsorP6_005956 [Peronosclerospora sorghi]
MGENGGDAKCDLAQRVRLNSRFYGVKAVKCVTRKGLSVKKTVAGIVAAALDVDVETVWRIQHALEPKDESKSPSSVWSLLCTMCECSVEIQAMSLRPHEVQSPLLGDLCGQVKYLPLVGYEEMSQCYKPQFKMEQSHKVLIERFTLKGSVPTALCDGRRAHY